MIGCLHIADFPAWARQSQRPSCRAIAVYWRGEIVARSRLLEQSGLQLGESLGRARSLFPDARFFEQDRPFDQAVWESVVQQINEITPFLSPVDYGWAFFRPYSFSEACDLSGSLLASVGLGPNRSIAQLAALRSASGSVLQIKRSAVGRFLTSTKVDVLLGLGFEDVLVERLQLFGLATLASVGRLTKRHLNAQFGNDGVALYDLLHPNSRSEHVTLYTPPATIDESFDLDGAPLEWLPTTHLLKQLSMRASRRLGHRLCRRVTVQIATSRRNGISVAQRILKKPSANSGEIFRAASLLLEHLLQTTKEADEITLSLGGLRSAHHHQASLFSERPPLAQAVKNLDERFPGAIRRAVVVNPNAPFPEDVVQYAPFSA